MKKGTGSGTGSVANDRAMAAGPPQSAIRSIARRDVRNDGAAAGRLGRASGPRVYRRRPHAIVRWRNGAMAQWRACRSFAIKMRR
ncbi:TPA: hypothetical protein QDB13_004811 [Burkholderia vietnamiensis]|uniref:Uncharacterized protein n=1 Tax=Burkholderia vietnamiensis TaxID=60552 RepID=A0AAW7T7D2_BURVI|nr:hypothetical protein [Burkholderia vietnamiensis]MDN7798077.1 hypothetical protein [Burkholderia vietnamiensis]HDR8967160.1 hypothetical protein [Burkholderia vietnamiensis]HDR9190287.1 hypothetical protein [Burkholderia vietnamiensis]HDR9354226.1 hypothetical protein [Burkholderia vietnamiensis]